MKFLYTLLFFALFITPLSAQIQKGTILLDGTVGFNSTNQNGQGVTTVNISPSAGFFLNNRFALGSSLNLSLSAGDGSTVTVLGLSPFARGYFNESGPARFFGQANVGFQSILSDGDGVTWLVFGAGVGADFFLNEHVAIEGSLGYNRIQDVGDEGINIIGLNFGIAAFISSKKE